MQELLRSIGIVCLYFIPLALLAFILRFSIRVPNEIFRKLLHFILLGSMPVFVFALDDWRISALTAVTFAVVVYPILMGLERIRSYSAVVTERKKGELKSSLLLVFGMFAVVISVCWGWLNDPWLALTSVYAWGVGDAFAAIIGKKFGTHKFRLNYVDPKKSVEGTAAMFFVSLLSVAALLMCRGGLTAVGYLVIPVITAAVSAMAELYSKNGMDTVICPLAAMLVLVPQVWLFGGV